MSEVEIVVAALSAGAAAGMSSAAQTAVTEAYAGLRDLVRRALTRHGHGIEVLDTVAATPGPWQVHLGEALRQAGADRDARLLAAARALLELTGRSGTVQVGTDYGAVAGTMSGPVQITYGQVPDPPAAPGA